LVVEAVEADGGRPLLMAGAEERRVFVVVGVLLHVSSAVASIFIVVDDMASKGDPLREDGLGGGCGTTSDDVGCCTSLIPRRAATLALALKVVITLLVVVIPLEGVDAAAVVDGGCCCSISCLMSLSIIGSLSSVEEGGEADVTAVLGGSNGIDWATLFVVVVVVVVDVVVSLLLYGAS
jgi:hypothetical protein